MEVKHEDTKDMTQLEAIEYLKDLHTKYNTYRISKLLQVSWPTVRNWLSEKPKAIQFNNLQKIENFKNANPNPN